MLGVSRVPPWSRCRLGCVIHGSAGGGQAAGHGSMVTLIAWPLVVVVSAVANWASGMWWVMRSVTGIAPEAMRLRAWVVCAGLAPLVPETGSSW